MRRILSKTVWYVQGFRKNDALLRFLEVEEFDAAIIFTRTKTGTLDVTELLEKHGFRAAALKRWYDSAITLSKP